ncbi:ABC transporter ATP-binding protein/permease [Apilactobacillus sp. TMW 2.2459]|uniref:ATP-binding cassette domain-containing protein n=1 Tax=Apilactobacillus xinyiensis TaxID=2841032 RepID=UPI00200FD0AD|nr:ABC transporter ATP-binding protein [Apilactobacillus xinyiensis]MCL0312523.1 ABC transporter ATP-binding protein/permease [Apilactobacillus xinyiensis]
MLHKKTINLKWILHNVPKSILFLTFLLCIFSSFEAILNGYIIGQIVNINMSDYKSVFWFLLKAFAAYVVTYLSIYGFLSFKSIAIKHLNRRLKYLFFNIGFKAGMSESEVVSNITNISKQIEQNYFNPIFMMVQVLITIVSSLIFILKTNFVLGMIYLVFSFMSLLPSYIGSKKLNSKTNVWSQKNSTLINILSNIMQGRNEIRNFGVCKAFFKKFNVQLSDTEHAYRDMSQFQYAIQLVSWGIALVSFLGPVAIGIYLSRFSALGITTSAIISLVLTSDSVVGGMRELTSYQSVIKSTDDIRVIKYEENNIKVTTTPQDKISKDDGLLIKDVAVNLNHKIVFDNINLYLKSNDKAIIMGASGVGKSTLLGAITGNVPLDKGMIKFNSHDISNQDYILISQNLWIFNGTLRDNITLYSDFSDAEVMRVIEQVGLLDELGPDPLNFHIKTNGENLSGGQNQRISIARGLIRNRKLFLLDEVASKLDSENAVKIRNILYSLPVTILEVAHNIDYQQVEQFKVKQFKLTKDSLKIIS